MPTIPQYEPKQFASGLTISFQRTFTYFSYEDGFTVAKYTINGSAGSATITGSYSDGIWTFTLPVASNILPAGQYVLCGIVEKGSGASLERKEFYRGSLEVIASLATATATDQRSSLQKDLDLLNTAIAAYYTNPVEEITINGRAFRKPRLIDLVKLRAITQKLLREYYRNENVKNGRSTSRTILTKFVNT